MAGQKSLKILAIIQARMNSRRLPGKVLLKINDKPLIGYLLDRLQRSTQLDGVIVATSTNEADEPLVRYCKDRGVECFRGTLDNVADRFFQILEKYPMDAFVRINGDSPLLDPYLVDTACAFWRKEKYDIVTNVLKRTFPKGQSVEVLKTEIFKNYYPNMLTVEDLEHVTPYFYRNASQFRIFNIEKSPDFSGFNLCVDTPEDLWRFEAILGEMTRPFVEYRWEELVGICRHSA